MSDANFNAYSGSSFPTLEYVKQMVGQAGNNQLGELLFVRIFPTINNNIYGDYPPSYITTNNIPTVVNGTEVNDSGNDYSKMHYVFKYYHGGAPQPQPVTIYLRDINTGQLLSYSPKL